MGFSAEKATRYSFALNNKKFLFARKGEAQCLPPKAKMMFRGPMSYWRVSYRIRFVPNVLKDRTFDGDDGPVQAGESLGWQLEYLDVGQQELVKKDPNNATTWYTRPIIGIQRKPLTEQTPLNGAGGEASYDPDLSGKRIAVYIQHRIYNYEDFQELWVQGLR